MYPYHPSYLFMVFYQPIRRSLVGWHVVILGNYGRSTKCRQIMPISEPCFQMVSDVKFHPVVMVLDLLPVQLPNPGLLLVVVLYHIPCVYYWCLCLIELLL